MVFVLATVVDLLITMQKPVVITPIKIRFAIFSAVIVFFFLLFNSRKDNETIGYVGILIICALLVAISETDILQVKRLFYVMCGVCVFLALYIIIAHFDYSIYENLILNKLPESIRVYNGKLRSSGYGISIGGSIIYADYLMATTGIALFAALLHDLRGPWKINIWRIVMIAGLGLFLLAMYIEGRRGEMLCFMTTLIIMFLISFYKAGTSVKLKKIAMIILVLLMSVLLLTVVFNSGNTSRIVSSIAQVAGSSDNTYGADISTGRFGRWKLAWDLFLMEPIKGIGWGRYVNYFMGDQKSSMVSVLINYKNTHNDYLNVLCETGIIGFILLYLPLLINFYVTWKQNRYLIRKSKVECVDKRVLILNTFCLGSQIFWATLGLLDPVLYKQLFLCYFALTTICVNAVSRVRKGIENEVLQAT